MGVFKVNGTDITILGEVIDINDTRSKSTFFNSGKVSVTGLSDSEKTMANAPSSIYEDWGFYNIVGNKLKVNGINDSVAKRGTRPHLIQDSGLRVGYISNNNNTNNVSFTLTYSSDSNSITCEHIDSITGNIGGCLVDGAILENTSVVIIQLNGGGGGGGGSGIKNGGGGGGGAGNYIALLDFNQMPGNKVTIVLGHYGKGGVSTSITGVDGGDGGDSYIQDGNETILAYARGGSGGKKGKEGNSGKGGIVEDIVGITSYFRIYSSCSGGDGGDGGKGELYPEAFGESGDNTTSVSVFTPDGSYTPNSYSGGSGGTITVDGTNHYPGGGGGGAPGAGTFTVIENTGSNGANGLSSASGTRYAGFGGGGAGGSKSLQGFSGFSGGTAMCYIFY